MSIFEQYEAAANPDSAAAMAAYMKNQFAFLGIPKPQRAELSREYLRVKKAENATDWDFVNRCYARSEREYQYLALEYLNVVVKRLMPDALPQLERLITEKSWWDTVDTISSFAGDILLRHPEAKSDIIRWMHSGNLWLQRVSIICQLKFKARTDTDLLSRAILSHCDTKEFFLNKAIGWALREYSKTDPQWVRDFIAAHTLHPLSVREASKYI